MTSVPVLYPCSRVRESGRNESKVMGTVRRHEGGLIFRFLCHGPQDRFQMDRAGKSSKGLFMGEVGRGRSIGSQLLGTRPPSFLPSFLLSWRSLRVRPSVRPSVIAWNEAKEEIRVLACFLPSFHVSSCSAIKSWRNNGSGGSLAPLCCITHK